MPCWEWRFGSCSGFAVIGVLLLIAIFPETRRDNQQREAPSLSAAGVPRAMCRKRG